MTFCEVLLPILHSIFCSQKRGLKVFMGKEKAHTYEICSQHYVCLLHSTVEANAGRMFGFCIYTQPALKWSSAQFVCPLAWIAECDILKTFVVRRAGLLWSQEDFEWRRSVPLFKCLTVLEFSFILFDLCLLITFFNFIMNYVPIVTFWIFTYHKIWILSIMFCSIWSYWIIYFLACLEVSWRVVS